MTAPLIFTPEYYARLRELEGDNWWNAGMRDVAAALLRLVTLPESGTMLDVGCGSGQTMSWFRSLHPGWRTVGIDVSGDAVAAARRDEVRVSRASGLELPFAARSVDVVVTLDVIQHLPLGGGDRRALVEMRRVLRPGGLLLLRTNAQATPHVPDDPEYNFHKYRPDELRAKLSLSGFDVIRLSRINGMLGLAEIPRELRAAHERGRAAYNGVLAHPRSGPEWSRRLKHGWLQLEGRAVAAGARLPLGRTIIALARRRSR